VVHQETPSANRLEGKLTLVDATAQSIGFMGPVFSMAFLVPLLVGLNASGKGAGMAAPLAVLLAAIGVLGLGWIVSEYARRIAAAGSLYDYISDGFGSRVGAGFGFLYYAGILGLGGLTLRNTVVANVAGNVYVNGNCHDLGGAKAAGDHVLQHAAAGTADGDCVAGGVQRGDPLLGALGDHGGPTETALPATGSPAFGAGATCPATDQRGVSRPAACTLGAAEAP